MTTTNFSTYEPLVPYVGNDYEEPETTATRVHLGLRPTFYYDADTTPHPDTSVCPSWCYVRTDPAWTHEKTADRPMFAPHGGPTVATVASLYCGERAPNVDGEPDYVTTATLRTYLEQQGSETATITVGLHCSDEKPRPPDRRTINRAQRLRLSIEDARELAIALNHLVGLADHG